MNGSMARAAVVHSTLWELRPHYFRTVIRMLEVMVPCRSASQ